MSRTESKTRQEIIDQQLARAGWGVSLRSMVEEFLVRVAARDEDYAQLHGFVDYALLGRLPLLRQNGPDRTPLQENGRRRNTPMS